MLIFTTVVAILLIVVGSVSVSYAVFYASAKHRRSLLVRDPLAPYVNSSGQAVAQISTSDLPGWLESHRGFEIISIANVGPFVVIVYK